MCSVTQESANQSSTQRLMKHVKDKYAASTSGILVSGDALAKKAEKSFFIASASSRFLLRHTSIL
jgi:hypothetical protein